MSRLPWFRVYCEARTDRKLDALSDAQHRVWFNLLCYSAEREPRGCFEMGRLLAVEVARGDEELLDATVAVLVELQIVEREGTAGFFINFAERQYDRPSDRPEESRERKRKSRACHAESRAATH